MVEILIAGQTLQDQQDKGKTNKLGTYWITITHYKSVLTYFRYFEIYITVLANLITVSHHINLSSRSSTVDLQNYVFSGEWELIDVRIRRTEMTYACCIEPYPDVRFTIVIRRKTLYYLFNIIFPCLWLTILR